MAANELYGGRLSDSTSADSLAQYLEDAFDFVRQNDFGLDALPAEGREDRMMLFLGIARGLVDYLADHAAAFIVDDHGSTQAYRHSNTKDGHVRIRANGSVHP